MLAFFKWESMRFHLNYPPERGIEPEQTLQLLSKDQSLFTKEGYLREKIISYHLEIFLFKIVLSFWFRKTLIQKLK